MLTPNIGKVVHNGIVFNFSNWRDNIVDSNTIPQAISRLFTLLHDRQIDYLLVGGIALLHYVEGRNTEDIDLIMAITSLDLLPEISVTEQDEYFVRGRFESLQIDILLTRNHLFERVLRDYVTIQSFENQQIRCASVEGLLLLKLYALPSLYRQGSFARVGIYENDIATLLQAYRPEVNLLLASMGSYLSGTDLDSLREIVEEIQQRIARFGQGRADS